MMKTSVDIAIPVYNEEASLEKNIEKLLSHIEKKDLKRYETRLIIVNNASTDATNEIAKTLAHRHKNIEVINLPHKGRGRAIRACWLKSTADVLAYMDVDLSADLRFLKSLLNAVAYEGADIAIGSRLAKGAKVSGRTALREIMSRGYNLLTRLLFCASFKDAQCGFKAISKPAFTRLEPLIQNQNWFFDSELLIVADKSGMRVAEIPIIWKDDPSSTVKVAKTAKEDLLGLLRLMRTRPWKTLLTK